jgi:hypothetical protein
MLSLIKTGNFPHKKSTSSQEFCDFVNNRIDVIFFPVTNYTVQQNESDFDNEKQIEDIIPFIHIPYSDIPENKKNAKIYLVWSKCPPNFFTFLVSKNGMQEDEEEEKNNTVIAKKRQAFFKNFVLWPCEKFSHDRVHFKGREVLLRTRVYFEMAFDDFEIDERGDEEKEKEKEKEKENEEEEEKEKEKEEIKWSKEDHLYLQYLLIRICSHNDARLHYIKTTLIKLATKKDINDEDINEMIMKMEDVETEEEQLPTILKCLSNYLLLKI